MCGEKLTRKSAINCGSGSPPHVRGKDANKVLWMEKFRITPACAGKSHRRSNLHVQQGDHPRMCGEKSLLPSSPSQRMGSPPHVRGKAVKLAQYFDVTGITPACAGKSPSFRMISNKNGDHPRMCGEKPFRFVDKLGCKGSPPHVRGKDSNSSTQVTSSRITPACAGKRPRMWNRSDPSGDHPRMCGEKTKKIP